MEKVMHHKMMVTDGSKEDHTSIWKEGAQLSEAAFWSG